MESHAAADSKNTFYSFLMQFTPAARVGLIVFLLTLTMLVVGLGVRSVTRYLSPVNSHEPPQMVYEEPAAPPALVNLDRV